MVSRSSSSLALVSIWDWICNLLTDEQALEDGLEKLIERNKDKLVLNAKDQKH